MSFEIITNFSTINHYRRISDFFLESDEFTIVSPFLMENVQMFFETLNIDNIRRLNLITTLAPQSTDQIKKINALVSFIDFEPIKNGSVQCNISINNKLHGKVYFFKKNHQPIAAIISSANFTNSGLSFNHECGVIVRDEVSIRELENLLISSIEYCDISRADIYNLRDLATAFKNENPEVDINPRLELNLANIIVKYRWTNQLENHINYWLKPIGYTEGPVTNDRFFDSIEEDLHFSTIRPSGVNKKDILIAYGVGAKRILSIYQSISSPQYVTDEQIEEEEWFERWPWYITGKNLTPKFGLVWSTVNVYLNTLVSEFLISNPTGVITSSGSRDLGALSWGKDKIRLNPKFANFVINKIANIEDSL
jgi:HKD family nuclease